MFVVVVEQDDPLVFLVPADTAGVSVRSYNVVEGGGAGDVTFDGVMLGADARIGGEGQGQAIVDAAVTVDVIDVGGGFPSSYPGMEPPPLER